MATPHLIEDLSEQLIGKPVLKAMRDRGDNAAVPHSFQRSIGEREGL